MVAFFCDMLNKRKSGLLAQWSGEEIHSLSLFGSHKHPIGIQRLLVFLLLLVCFEKFVLNVGRNLLV